MQLGLEAHERHAFHAARRGALPTYGAEHVPTEAMKAAIEARLRAGGGRVAGHRVGYVDYPTSSVNSGGEENEGQCSRTAARIAKDNRVVAVVGPFSPVCARTLIPVLDRAGGAVVTPEITTTGLTHEVPNWRRLGPCFLCAPGNLYPTGDRNFARVVATEDSEGRVAADVLHRLGARRALVLTNGDQFDTYRYRLGVTGPYHQVAAFLSNVGSLSRIIAPINLSASPTTRSGEIKPKKLEQFLDARFQVQTYVAHTSVKPVLSAGRPGSP